MSDKKTCGLCNGQISFLNRITNSGGLNDGNIICYQCFQKLKDKDLKVFENFKIYSVQELKDILSQNTKPQTETLTSIHASVLDQLTKRERENIKKRLGKDEKILNIFPCLFSVTDGLLVMTEFKVVFISDGIFSLNGINTYYYNQMSRLKITDNSFSFFDLYGGDAGTREKITITQNSTQCITLLKEQITLHKKYDKDGYPYIILPYESGEIDKAELISRLLE